MTVPLQSNVPTPTYRIGFSAAPLDAQATIAWTDITTFTPADGIQRLRVLSRHSDAGKKDAQSKVDASRATYLLDNRDGAFTPTNTASAYWPNVKLGIVFQELQTWAGTTYPVFTGYIDDYDIRADVLGNPTVLIACVDAQKPLGLNKLEDSMFRIEVRKDVAANIAAGRNTAWLRLNDPSSSQVAADYSGLGFDGTYQGSPILGQKSLISGDTDTCMDVAHTADQRASLPYQSLISGFPFTIEFVFRVWPNRGQQRLLFAAYDGSDIVASNRFIECYIASTSEVAGAIYLDIANPYPSRSSIRSTVTVDDGVTHHCAIVATSSTNMHVWIDGSDFTVAVTPGSISYPPYLPTGYAIANTPSVAYGDYGLDAGASVDAEGNTITGGIQSFVVYDGLSLSSARIQKHAQGAIAGWGTVNTGSRVDQLLDTIGWPSADRAVDAGQTTVDNLVAGSTAVGYLQLLAETEGGRFFISPEGYPSFHERNRIVTGSRATTPQAVFDDAGGIGSVPYVPPFEPHLDSLETFYRASVTRVGGNPQVYDATPGSTVALTNTKTGLLMNSDAQARGMAQYLVSRGKVQSTHLRSLTFQPQESPTTGWPAALGLRQGDRITVKRNFEGCPTWISDWIVEGITHDWQSAETFWTTTLALSPADPAHYFIIGSSVLGGSDLLFY